MMTSVPQFIDVEDKVAGPFTWRQLGWMIAMGVTLFLLYTFSSGVIFYLLAVPTVILFVALAFFRPNGMAFPQFLFYSLTFLFRPKVSIWERPAHPYSSKSAPPEEKAPPTTARVVSPKDFSALAEQVDRK